MASSMSCFFKLSYQRDLHGFGRFALQYPHLQPTTLLAGLQDRVSVPYNSITMCFYSLARSSQVVESGQWWANGYYGRDWASLNATMFEVLPENNVTVSWITPQDTCKDWQYDYGNNVSWFPGL